MFDLFKTSKLQMLDDEIKSFENKLQQDAAGKLELLFILEVMARLSKFSDKFGCPWFKPDLAFVSVGKVFLTTVIILQGTSSVVLR